MKKIAFSIGGIAICFFYEENYEFVIQDSYKPFCSNETEHYAYYAIHFGAMPDISDAELVFDSEVGVWTHYRKNCREIISLSSPAIFGGPYNISIFTRDYRKGDIYLRYMDEQSDIFPMQFPFDELLFIRLLSGVSGILLHACGTVIDGDGTMLCGVSGVGKSTFANLLKDEEDVVILSDNRTILRDVDNGLTIYGTPWISDAKMCSTTNAPVKHIFFLRHGEKNHIKKLSKTEAFGELLKTAFPTFDDSSAMQNVLTVITKIISEISCYSFGFVPDKSAVHKLYNTIR